MTDTREQAAGAGEWHVEEIDLPGFKGEFLVRGETLAALEFMGMAGGATLLNAQERTIAELRAQLQTAHENLQAQIDSDGKEIAMLEADIEQRHEAYASFFDESKQTIERLRQEQRHCTSVQLGGCACGRFKI